MHRALLVDDSLLLLFLSPTLTSLAFDVSSGALKNEIGYCSSRRSAVTVCSPRFTIPFGTTSQKVRELVLIGVAVCPMMHNIANLQLSDDVPLE